MQNRYKYFLAVLLGGIMLVAGQAFSQSIKFNSIKPVAQTALTDEQQGILAMRTAKASVVDIIGIPLQTPPANTSVDSIGLSPSGSQDEVFGTGFVLTADGKIVSNNHVVGDATMKYYVILSDGTQYPATILYQDKYDDVALLKINAQNLTPAKLGDSGALETGQTVFAIGDSLGQYQYTVTRGVISALGRSVDEGNSGSVQDNVRLHNLIQTDASINPGNSGGPLVNLAGEVVGMNTLIDTSGSGLGFAVAINTIKDAVHQLDIFGKVSRPYLGIQFESIDPLIQRDKQLPVNSGALVDSVVAGSPAQSGGIMPGDIILAVNGLPLSQNRALDDALQSFYAGSQITLKVLRGSQNLELSVILGQLQ